MPIINIPLLKNTLSDEKGIQWLNEQRGGTAQQDETQAHYRDLKVSRAGAVSKGGSLDFILVSNLHALCYVMCISLSLAEKQPSLLHLPSV